MFSVLTPLPGTDFYEEVKDQLITDNYDCFDFVHTLLPTELPLRAFYKEYYNLNMKYVAFSKGMAYLRKFAWKDIPVVLLKALRYQKRLKKLYRDYEDPVAVEAGRRSS
jgi:hypothetical protein